MRQMCSGLASVLRYAFVLGGLSVLVVPRLRGAENSTPTRSSPLIHLHTSGGSDRVGRTFLYVPSEAAVQGSQVEQRTRRRS